MRFPGTYYDRETATLYNVHRDLDPATGRYLQPEPLGIAGDINLYRYARNNPLTYFDPDGEQATSALSTAGGFSTAPGASSGLGAAGSRGLSVLGPIGLVASAGIGGWQIGGFIYPYIAQPLGQAIDICLNSRIEECKQKCDAAYAAQIEICKMLKTKAGRRQCYANAANLYAECLANCK